MCTEVAPSKSKSPSRDPTELKAGQVGDNEQIQEEVSIGIGATAPGSGGGIRLLGLQSQAPAGGDNGSHREDPRELRTGSVPPTCLLPRNFCEPLELHENWSLCSVGRSIPHSLRSP